MQDLLILVADKNMEFAVRGALVRHQALGIRSIRFDVRTHPNRDGGVRTTGAQQVRLEIKDFKHALVILDIEGSGFSGSATELEARLDAELARDWGERSKSIVISPELESWIWGSDNAMESVLDWKESLHIREWLGRLSPPFVLSQNGKPERPKEAFEKVLYRLKRPRSSSQYQALTSKISLQGCKDEAFSRLRSILRSWFPPESE
ncbi:MAG: hypothetical protein GQE15_31625 [Archangiaceae bacterium]|nr:hypothetical protein [Archangiaceae bacterium]